MLLHSQRRIKDKVDGPACSKLLLLESHLYYIGFIQMNMSSVSITGISEYRSGLTKRLVQSQVFDMLENNALSQFRYV